MRLFGWSGKFYFLEIEIRWPKKNVFDHGNHFTLLFSLQSISGKFYKERESAHAREEKKHSSQFDDHRRTPSSSPHRSRSRRQTFQSPLIAISPSRDRAVDRNLTFVRSHRIEIVIDGAILRSVNHDLRSSSLAYIRDLAIDASRDCDQRRLECLPARSRLARTGARSSPTIVGLTGMFLLLSRVRALSLSLIKFPEILWRENRSVKWFLLSKAFFSVNGFQFPENRIFRTNQTASFPEKHFRKWFSPKTNTALVCPINL